MNAEDAEVTQRIAEEVGGELCHEFASSALRFERQVEAPIRYRGNLLKSGLRLDLLVEETIVVEVKSIESIKAVHEAQLLSYLRLTGKPLGLLLNFNVAHFRNGIRRKAHTRKPSASSAFPLRPLR